MRSHQVRLFTQPGAEAGVTNPMFGIWCAVERTTYRGEVIEAAQAISVEEAIRMYSLNAAKLLQHDRDKGSLEPGKLADVIVLDRDIRKLRGEELRDARVDKVFVEGRQVYERTET